MSSDKRQKAIYCSIDITKTVTPHVDSQHWSAPSRVLGSPKSVSTGFTTVSERAGCVTRCKGRRFLKCSAHGGSVCVCVFANCSFRCYNDLHPTPFLRWHFWLLLPSCKPPRGQNGRRVIPACCVSLSLPCPGKDLRFFATEASRVIPRNPKGRKKWRWRVLFSRKSYFLHACDVHKHRCVIMYMCVSFTLFFFYVKKKDIWLSFVCRYRTCPV